MSNLDYLYNQCKSGRPTAEWRLDLQRVMHNNAGVYRNQDLLAEGCDKLDKLAAEMKDNLKVRIFYYFFLIIAKFSRSNSQYC